MKNLLPIIIFLLIIYFLSSCQNKPNEIASTRPNVILIMTDDQGYGDLGCHGNPWLKTPNLDKLHGQSIRLKDFHVGTTCSPTRAALMTGRNCNRVGVWHTIAGRSQLNADEMTMADVFDHNGYQTAMFGKWHLGDSYPFNVGNRGFEHTFYHGGGGVGQMPDYWDNDYFGDTYFLNENTKTNEEYCTNVWFNGALNFIDKKRKSEEPFFVYLATNAPHGPFHVDSAYMNPYWDNPQIPNPNFYGMIANLDENMGLLMSKLDDWQLTENTILVFLTDNGTAGGVRFDKNNEVVKGYNADMRGIKGSEYEGGHRVPCFIQWPAQDIQGGKDVSALTAHVDLLPTFIDLIDLELPKPVEFDGTSIVDLLKGKNDDSKWSERVLITDTQREEHPQKWKKSSVMMDKWRLVNGEELYDIQTDPSQKNNIADQNTDLVEKLKAAYENWWDELSPGFETYSRVILGEDDQPVVLFSHDWHETEDNLGEPGRTPWHQTHIRQGLLANGFWTIDVAESGTYNIELRRWPAELDAPITGGIPTKEAVPGGKPMAEGSALPLTKARIKVGSQEESQEIESEAKSATFQVELEKGPAQLKTWFEGEGDLKLGAYYVYISRVGE